MKEIKDKLVEQMSAFLADADKPTKAAHKRMRKATIEIAKLGKEFRRLSLEEDNK